MIGIDTTTPVDQPSMRGDQLIAALEAAEDLPELQGVADFDRTAPAGWSMGGGGSLDAARSGDFDAIIPIAPFNVGTYEQVTEPTLIIAGQADVIAPSLPMARTFYEQVHCSHG